MSGKIPCTYHIDITILIFYLKYPYATYYYWTTFIRNINLLDHVYLQLCAWFCTVVLVESFLRRTWLLHPLYFIYSKTLWTQYHYSLNTQPESQVYLWLDQKLFLGFYLTYSLSYSCTGLPDMLFTGLPYDNTSIKMEEGSLSWHHFYTFLYRIHRLLLMTSLTPFFKKGVYIQIVATINILEMYIFITV